MSESEASKRLRLWPKLLLWGVVIVIGFLYLGSVKKHESRVQEPTTGVQNVEVVAGTDESVTPGPLLPGVDLTKAENTAGSEVEEADANNPLQSVSEPAALSEQAPDSALAVPQPLGVAGAPEPEHNDAEFSAISDIPASQPEVNESPREVTPVEAKAFAEAVLSEGEADTDTSVADATSGSEIPAQMMPSVPVLPTPADLSASAPLAPAMSEASVQVMPSSPGAAVPGVPAPAIPSTSRPAVAVAPEAPVKETMEDRRAHVRRAEEEMRRYWGQRGMPPPYSYPGYTPGHYPRRQ